MKSLYHIIFTLMFSCSLAAQTPQKISYQAVIHNSNNQLVTNQQTSLRISILHDSVSGTAVYVENHSPTTNNNGLVSLEIGGGTVVSGSLSSINWSDGSYFIKTETDPTGGLDYCIVGISQLLSVPYALYAKTAETCLQTTNNSQHSIGDFFGGGIVIYTYDNGQHGLIASLKDLPVAIWGDSISSIDAYSSYDGLENSLIISSQPSNKMLDYLGSATFHCLEYRGGGYDDWYLPSIFELNLLYEAAYMISIKLNNDNNSETSGLNMNYWSSTANKGRPSIAFMKSFINGDIFYYNKKNYSAVRAIRRF